jgi:hypothetical protein
MYSGLGGAEQAVRGNKRYAEAGHIKAVLTGQNVVVDGIVPSACIQSAGIGKKRFCFKTKQRCYQTFDASWFYVGVVGRLPDVNFDSSEIAGLETVGEIALVEQHAGFLRDCLLSVVTAGSNKKHFRAHSKSPIGKFRASSVNQYQPVIIRALPGGAHNLDRKAELLDGREHVDTARFHCRPSPMWLPALFFLNRTAFAEVAGTGAKPKSFPGSLQKDISLQIGDYSFDIRLGTAVYKNGSMVGVQDLTRLLR